MQPRQFWNEGEVQELFFYISKEQLPVVYILLAWCIWNWSTQSHKESQYHWLLQMLTTDFCKSLTRERDSSKWRFNPTWHKLFLPRILQWATVCCPEHLWESTEHYFVWPVACLVALPAGTVVATSMRITGPPDIGGSAGAQPRRTGCGTYNI